MYKRINKRIKKKEEEEALGLDGETKEMLGMPETDSDESDSSDEDPSDGGSEESDGEGKAKSGTTGRRRNPKVIFEGADSDIASLSGVEMEGSEEDEEEAGDDEGEDQPPMSISEALNNPLYSIGKGSETQGCILCPGKELKHAKMASIHVESSSHLRRMKRFTALVTRVGDEEEDPRLLVAALDESVRIVPREKSIKAFDGPRVPKKERFMAKRERRRERRAAQKVDKQIQEKSVDVEPNPKSDRVLEKKILNRHSQAIVKHKAKSKHPKLHKSLKAKNSVV
ncbi:hypothetical protein RSOLAG22IIIB_03572 [Rhizoctonia solani]|uniref:Uncharacterized protein n=1 Tax=Rhizoctonia solani TaxID=456999 RepID=A0A0K6FRC8_9AGAM|nr:hypothetical protein RSOLAG22IIIB_03572 [Rhizoctonia solani]